MSFYDVVVIGAGPAGLNCAQKLAESGAKVVVLEKNAVVGPKVCAGGMTEKARKYLGLPDSVLDRSFGEICFHTPLSKVRVRTGDHTLHTVEREKLGQWQLSRLREAGAEIRTGTRATAIDGDAVTINHSEKVRFEYLVGADGSASILRRHLGLRSSTIGIGLQYRVPGDRFSELEIFYNSRRFHCWYAWIFPHGEYSLIGCGYDRGVVSTREAIHRFKRWLQVRKIDVHRGKYEAQAINSDYRGHAFGKLFLAGDAAGLASGFTGEGIYQALISGEEVARTIIQNDYASAGMEELLKRKRSHEKVLRVLKKSGPLRSLEYEIVSLLLRTKRLREKILDIVA